MFRGVLDVCVLAGMDVSDTVAQEIVTSLQVLETVATSLHASLLPQVGQHTLWCQTIVDVP